MNFIFVAGMHRSGTSFVTELVHAMGAQVGTRLLEPAPDNPHGFWEHVDVKRINDELLARLGGTWDRPPTGLTASWPHSAGLDRLRREAEELVSDILSERPDAPAFVIKDPRLSLTAPFWNSVVTADVSLVPLRHPVEVVQSLRHRNGMAPSRAAALWTRYTLSALVDLPNPRVIPLHGLMEGSHEAVAELAHHVGLMEGIAAASEIARSRGRNWQPKPVFSAATSDEELQLALALFSLLDWNVEVDVIRPALAELADRWAFSPYLRPEQLVSDDSDDMVRIAVRSASERVSELQRDVENENLMAAELRTERDQARRELRSTAQRLSAAETSAARRISEVESALADSDARARLLEAHSSVVDQRLKEAERKLEAERNRADDHTRRAEAVTTRSSTLERAVEATRAERDAQARRARAAERQFERLKLRRSVRVALALTGIFQPVFQVIRRVRRGRPTTPSSAGSKGAHSDSEAVRVQLTRRGTTIGGAVPRQWTRIIDRLEKAPPTTVIVPVYNAADEVERCIARLLAWTPINHDILIIDDASTDPRIREILAAAESAPNVRILLNDANLGFTRTVNRGFASTSNDVVILNSDARVGPNWLINLRIAAYSGDRIASASAVSDNAGAFSLPESGTNQSPGIDETSLARLYAQRSARHFVASPTGHGFCMFIRRDALDTVGGFDVDRFPRGYGEENDWSMRALKAGWTNVVDESTMVFHSNAASFDPAMKTELVAAARERVNELHPDYTARIRTFLEGDLMRVREQARRIDAHAQDLSRGRNEEERVVRPRVLSVVQAGRGGTPKTNEDLMVALEDEWDPWILTSDGQELKLYHVVGGAPALVDQITAAAPLGANRPSDVQYREFLARIVITMGFELVHVRHLFKHSQRDIPEIVRALGIPAVLSFHDYYWICPNVHLLDERGQYCAGRCTPSPGDCDLPVPGEPLTVPLKHNFVHDWQRTARDTFDAFDEFVTTSVTARNVLQESYPELEARGITVIAHGRDLAGQPSVAVAPDPDRVRIVVIGNLSGPKGGHFLRELLARDSAHLLDVHIVGECDPEFLDLRCTFHGPYQREQLRSILAPLRPSFAALLSVWPETWSHTLTEAWSMGLPVLVPVAGGALSERVSDHGGGWVIDSTDAGATLDRILAISRDASVWQEQALLAMVDHLPSIAQMADNYRKVYALARGRIANDLTFVDVRVVTDQVGKSPGSAHVRSLRRFSHPAVRRKMRSTRRADRSAHSKAGIPNVLWVQRNAVPTNCVDDILLERDRRQARLIVDLDDDLLHAEGLPRKFAQYVPTMRRLVEAADLVTVSTAPLAEVVRPWADRVEVLPNQLDETLWWPSGEQPLRKPENDRLDILYMGTDTHARDLELVREPFLEFARSRPESVQLHVVGGAPARDDEWFRRIRVPDEAKEYPSFVTWLRSIGDRFDFAIAPLERSTFNSSKSDLKFLEYAALGLPSILSDCPAYQPTVTHGVDGYLSGDACVEWYRAFETMSSRSYQEEIRDGARSLVETRTIGRTADSFIELIEGLL